MAKKSGLGRGLDSLIPKKTSVGYQVVKNRSSAFSVKNKKMAEEGLINIDINKIVPNPHQPRVDFSHQELEDLILSIREHGIIQPLVVTKSDSGYELIAGERRLRAAKVAGLKKVPAILRSIKEQEKLELALIENIQRQNLNPLEEAEAFQKLMREFSLTQEKLAKKIGKSRSVIANTLRLLGLPDEVKQALRNRKITSGHARIIAGLSTPKEQLKFLTKILNGSLSVHGAEQVKKNVVVKKHLRKVDPNLRAKEEELQQALGTKVRIKKRKDGGEVAIEYYSQEELDNIINKII